jgi:energy-coupling factor transport system substrate-specific component
MVKDRASWTIGRRELRMLLVGPLLFAGLTWVTNIFLLPAAPNLQIRPAVVVPLVVGFVFGPIVGFATGLVGNLLSDFLAGYLHFPPSSPTGNLLLDLMQGVYLHWQVGNGLLGLVTGISALFYRRYKTFADQVRAVIIALFAVVVGIGFASFTHPLIDPSLGLAGAFAKYFRPLVTVDAANVVVLLPIVLFNYAHLEGESSDWLHSFIFRRVFAAILASAAVPIVLLGLFLTQQTTGRTGVDAQVWIKLGLTTILTFAFIMVSAALLAQSILRPLLRLTAAARAMQAGKLTSAGAGQIMATEGTDEVTQLSRVFGQMAEQVISREESLRKQVQALRIEIDEAKRTTQVAEITETEYFQNLQRHAGRLRARSGPREPTNLAALAAEPGTGDAVATTGRTNPEKG